MQGMLFAKILKMSLTGSCGIGIVLAVRILLKRCGRIYAYQLWVLTFVSLCLPVSLPGSYSLIPESVATFSLAVAMESRGNGQEGASQDVPGLTEPSVTVHRLSPEGISSGYLKRMTGGMEPKEQTFAPAAESGGFGQNGGISLAAMEKIWLLGIVAFGLYDLIAWYHMARRCARYGLPKQKKGVRIVEAESVPSPFLWGFFRPVIYLPSGLTKEERTYILAHEMVHRNRRDHLVKPLILAVTILHWFNPLVWLAFALCCYDMEIACDEAVLENSRTNIRKAYAQSLLTYAAGQNRFLLSPPGFGEPSVKSRIQNVLRFRKKSIWISLAAGLMVGGVAVGLLHHPSGEEALPEPPVQEAEPLPEGEEPAVDESEGLVVNNGGEILGVAGAYYYMDRMPLYSDGEAIYSSVLGDDGVWHVCRYETDGSGFRWLFDGRIVDSTEYGQALYCMLPSENGSGDTLGWYDTRTQETGRFSGEGISYLGKYAGYLYITRQEADGLHIGRIREIDRTKMVDPVKEGIPAENILKFYGDEGSKRLVFAAESFEKGADRSGILCYSYDMESGALKSRELTGLPYFFMMDGRLYFQRYRSREDTTMELYRTDYDFAGEEQIGEGLTLLCAEEETGTLLAGKQLELPEYDRLSSLVRVWPDQKKEQVLLDMEKMLPAVRGEDQGGDADQEVSLDWEFQPGDWAAYSDLNQLGERLYVTVSHMRDPQDTPLEEVHLTIDEQGGIGLWFPEELTPGYEDDSWYYESMVGDPVGMEAKGWDLENAEDVREHFQELPAEPDASERRKIYLLGETEYWTLYGKGDYETMLLERNGRYTEIHHPYMSNYQMEPELMEADLDRDGITELAICFNLKHGTGISIDSLLLADFQNNGAWGYQFLEADFTEQLTAHLTYERTEHGLQAFIDGAPAGAPVEDEEGGRIFQTVSVGQLVHFTLDETEEKIQIRAELEFWAPDSPGTAEYNGGAIEADVSWTGEEFSLRDIRYQEL